MNNGLNAFQVPHKRSGRILHTNYIQDVTLDSSPVDLLCCVGYETETGLLQILQVGLP